MRTVGLLGIPFDAHSSYQRGAAAAPGLIRDALRCDSSNLWSEAGVDLGAAGALFDAGDLELPPTLAAFELIESAVRSLLDRNYAPLCLGGDHSVTYAVVKAFASCFDSLTIVHFDAHPDLYQEFQGNRFSHACPFARILEERLVARLIQVGIRTMNVHQREQAKRFAVEVFTMSKLPEISGLRIKGPVYVSFDMDALDPAFAPGVSHREAGGLSVREAIALIHAIPGPIVGADIVEYNPARDWDGVTSVAAAKILKELAGRMIG